MFIITFKLLSNPTKEFGDNPNERGSNRLGQMTRPNIALELWRANRSCHCLRDAFATLPSFCLVKIAIDKTDFLDYNFMVPVKTGQKYFIFR